MNAYVTSPSRIVLGFVAGVTAGSVLVMLWSFVGMTLSDAYWFRHALTIFASAAAVWATGLLLIASVPWFLLHRFGWRGWPVAIVLGLVLTFLVVFAALTNGFGAYRSGNDFSAADSGGPTWVNGRLTAHGWFAAFQFAAICSAMGAAVGLAVWRVAYRRVADDKASRDRGA